MKLIFKCSNDSGWTIWPHAELPPDHLLTAPSIEWDSSEETYKQALAEAIELARTRISAAIHAPFERERFERWATANDLVIVRLGTENYPSPTTQAAWCAWLARSADNGSVPTEKP